MRLSVLFRGFVVASCLITPFAASAQSPEKVFAGKILFSIKRFPTQAKTPGEYTAALRKQAETNFYEDKEKKQWKVNFAAFFSKALDDIAVQIKISDGRTPISSFDQYLDEKGQQSFVSSMVLTEKQYGVNKELTMTLYSHGKTLSVGKFKILGKATKNTGKVDFSPSGGKKKA